MSIWGGGYEIRFPGGEGGRARGFRSASGLRAGSWKSRSNARLRLPSTTEVDASGIV